MGDDLHSWLAWFARTSNYRRLRSAKSRRKRVRIARLGSKRSWIVRRLPKFRIRFLSPLVLLSKLRDAYISFMLSASAKLNSPDLITGNFRSNEYRAHPFGELKAKEYEAKILEEIYKSLAQSQWLPKETQRNGFGLWKEECTDQAAAPPIHPSRQPGSM